MSEIKLEKFIAQLEEEFEEIEPGALKADTSFRDLDEWSSMHALIIIALIDAEYGVTISGDDLRSATTVQDVFEVVKAKIA